MKVFKYFLFLVLGLILVTSCKKDLPTNENQISISSFTGFNPFNFPGDKVNGYVLVLSNQIDGQQQPSNISVTGSLKDDGGSPLEWDVLSVNGIRLEAAKSLSGDIKEGIVLQHFSTLNNSGDYNKLIGAFEAGQFQYKFDEKEKAITASKLIDIDVSANSLVTDDDSGFFQFNMKKDLIIRWNKEESGDKTGLSDIGISVVYESVPSRAYIDENLPSENRTITKLSDDTGEIIITADELQQNNFPQNGLITITVARGSVTLVEVFDDLEVVVGDVTYEASDYIQLVEH